jgi:predicted molibdopterin-dependent oxidoreductase YjgC
MAVRAVADGKAAAASIDQFLAGQPVVGAPKLYTTRIGRLHEGEIAAFMAGASDAARVEPAGDGFSDDEARAEAARCLHCDCRKPASCRLRRYAEAYGASPAHFRGERRRFEQHARHPEVLFEPGKCIDCGLCVQIAASAGEALGLTFIGRGFSVRVGVPFGESLADALATVARECAAACPTGALAPRDAEETGRTCDRGTTP